MAGPWEKYQASPGSGPWERYGGGSATPAPEEPPAAAEPQTTAGGLAASFTRGLAPIAAGAAIGAGIGSIIPGPGTAAGAVAGGLAAGAADLGGTVYNFAARHTGLPEIATPSSVTGKALDVMGLQRPSTGLERAAEFAGGMAPLGAGSAKGAVKLGEAVMENRADAAERFITDAYTKAVRPTVIGKGTASKIAQADENVLNGVMSIAENKGNLRLADRAGREVVGRAPRTLDEFLQSIEQTKRPIFDKYHSMAQQAESQGAAIDTKAAAAELRKFAADPAFKLPQFDAMRNFATKNADVLDAQGSLSPTVAERTIRNLNEGLSGFYRKSSPEAAGTAAVNDLIANNLRHGVDQTLERYNIPGYQEAKRQYGALKSIESEVAHRAVIFGRADPGGGVMGRLGSIASYEELARFATHLDPSALASAVAIRGGRTLIERLHSPNRAIKRMFERVDQLPPRPQTAAPPATGGMQPPRPSGAGGGYPSPNAGTAGLQAGGASAPPAPPMQTMGVQPARPSSVLGTEQFYMPPGGGQAF